MLPSSISKSSSRANELPITVPESQPARLSPAFVERLKENDNFQSPTTGGRPDMEIQPRISNRLLRQFPMYLPPESTKADAYRQTGKYGIGLNKEEVMGYDYHVRMQEWDEVIAMAEKKAPDTPMSVSCLNLALAMKGQLPERMFSFYQRGKEGLLMSFVNDFTIPLVAGEPYYYLPLIKLVSASLLKQRTLFR